MATVSNKSKQKTKFRKMTQQQNECLRHLLDDKEKKMVDNQRHFYQIEAKTASSNKDNHRIKKKSCIRKPASLYIWNQLKRHIENYTVTVIWHNI